MAKCLIAGLPEAGKTTYIAALSYQLHNPNDKQILSIRELPNDMSVINRLQNPWLEQRIVDRTSRGKVTDLEFKLKRNADGKSLDDPGSSQAVSALLSNPDLIYPPV